MHYYLFNLLLEQEVNTMDSFRFRAEGIIWLGLYLKPPIMRDKTSKDL